MTEGLPNGIDWDRLGGKEGTHRAGGESFDCAEVLGEGP